MGSRPIDDGSGEGPGSADRPIDDRSTPEKPKATSDDALDIGEVISRISLAHGTTKRRDFRNRRFTDLNGLGGTFENCDFSFSIFERAYLRNAKFLRCSFRGCRFEDSNLRGVTLASCDLGYATFVRTLLDPKEIVASLPLEPNLRRDLLQNLRANAVEIGDYGSQRLYVLQEVEARKDHLSKAMYNSGDYYRSKYGSFLDRSRAALELCFLAIGGWIWGNGERPLRMIGSALVLLALFSLINLWAVLPRVPWPETKAGLEVFRYSVDQFLDTQPSARFRGFAGIDYALVFMRYVYIGLFISVLAKSMSHR